MSRPEPRRTASPGRRSIVSRRRLRPAPECLEARALLALTWTGAGTNPNWSNPANWDAGRAPVSGDVLIFADGPAVASRDSTDDLDLNLAGLQVGWSGQVNLAHALTVSGAFSLSVGELTGPGTLTLGGPASWTGGTMSGTGTTQIPAGSTLAIDGAANKMLRRHLVNAGTTTWDGTGELLAGSNAAFDNLAGALFLARNDGMFDTADSAGGVFNNAGTFRKSGTSGTTALMNTTASSVLTFNNTGVVDVRSGTLDFQDGGSSHGLGNAFTIAAGSHATFSGFFALTDTTFTGDGSVRLVGSGVLNVAGNVSATNIDQLGGTIAGLGRLAVSGLDHWSGGSQTGAGSTSILAGARLLIDGADKFLVRDLDNAGAATWTGAGALLVGGGTTFHNLAGGLFDIQSDSRYDTFSVSTATLLNDGTLRKSAGAGATSFQATYPGSRLVVLNRGTIEALSGALALNVPLPDVVGGALTAGTYRVTATLVLGTAPIATNAAAIVLDGASAQIKTASGGNALASLTANAPAGRLTLDNGARLTLNGGLANAGALSLLIASVLVAPGGYTQTAGSTDLEGGTLNTGGGASTIAGGVLSGSGTVAGDLVNSALIEPGGQGAAATLWVGGNYRQTPAGWLRIELAGPPPAVASDRLVVAGAAELGGALVVNRLGGYAPARGAAFNAIATGAVRGHFATDAGLTLPGGLRIAAIGDGNGLELVTVGRSVIDDFDGDGRSDVAVYRPTTAQWFILDSGGGWRTLTFGAPNVDVPVPADYDGDGKTDIAVYRPTTGQWFILGSTVGPFMLTFGAPNLDLPVPADYDGDGRADVAVYRPTTAQWFLLRSSAGAAVVTFGAPNLDLPVPADYDGDGQVDVAVYRPSTAQWFLLQSSAGAKALSFGAPNLDLPIPGDYDGDGRADPAVYRPTTSQWFLLQSSGGPRAASFGAPLLDVPILADFDGDARVDLAVYRPPSAQWFALPSGGGATSLSYGAPNIDIPLGSSLWYRLARVAGAGKRSSGWTGG